MLNFILCRFSWLPPLIICCLPPSLPFFCIEDICGSWNSNITCERTFPKMTKRYVCVCEHVFKKLGKLGTVHVSDPLGSSPFAQFFGVHSGSPPCQGQRRCGGTKNSGKANKNGEIIRKPWEIYEILWISMRNWGNSNWKSVEMCFPSKKSHWEVHRRVSFQRPILNFECVKPFVGDRISLKPNVSG